MIVVIHQLLTFLLLRCVIKVTHFCCSIQDCQNTHAHMHTHNGFWQSHMNSLHAICHMHVFKIMTIPAIPNKFAESSHVALQSKFCNFRRCSHTYSWFKLSLSDANYCPMPSLEILFFKFEKIEISCFHEGRR